MNLRLKKLSTIFAVTLVQPCSLACQTDSMLALAQDPDRYFSESAVVFLGKISSIVQLDEYAQLATFTVNETYKGAPSDQQKVLNDYRSSCGRPFDLAEGTYYVFGKGPDSDNAVIVKGEATFIPLWLAETVGMEAPASN